MQRVRFKWDVWGWNRSGWDERRMTRQSLESWDRGDWPSEIGVFALEIRPCARVREAVHGWLGQGACVCRVVHAGWRGGGKPLRASIEQPFAHTRTHSASTERVATQAVLVPGA